MTFKQAYKEVKALAAGRFFIVEFKLTTFSSTDQKTQCRVYIDQPIGAVSAQEATWRMAIDRVRKQLPDIASKLDLCEEIPDVDDGNEAQHDTN